jgi:hypothetical protein
MGMTEVLGALAGLFALALLALPTVRVAQGALLPRRAIGLWLAGAGFALLSAAAFLLSGPAAHGAVVGGVAFAVIGNIVQRRAVREGL